MDIKELKIPGYERVIQAKDSASGLSCFIAIHSTKLGPALGGARFYPYANEEEALKDVLRLAEAMTLKSAMAEDGLGGGKSVIIGDPKRIKSPALLKAFGKAVETLKGSYVVAEDVGTTPEDMTRIREVTRYVAALPTALSSGDPSRFTAYGVFLGIQAASEFIFKRPSLEGITVAVQGLGAVGSKLLPLLFYEGAKLILSDLDPYQTALLAREYGGTAVLPDEILQAECDLFAPCALGGILNPVSIPTLRCKAIAGSANNQLLTPSAGELLHQRGILYAPDFVINSGGILNAAAEFDKGGYDAKRVLKKVKQLKPILLKIFEEAKASGRPTEEIALHIAKQKLNEEIGKRVGPLHFS